MTESKRSIGPAQLMLYGVGSMLGAGIYGLARPPDSWAAPFAGDISELASATVLLLLVVFVLVNGALIVLKRRKGDIADCFNAPTAVPAIGALICLGMIVGRALQDDWRGLTIAGALIGLILLLYALTGQSRTRPVCLPRIGEARAAG